jgi:hypothetical protein
MQHYRQGVGLTCRSPQVLLLQLQGKQAAEAALRSSETARQAAEDKLRGALSESSTIQGELLKLKQELGRMRARHAKTGALATTELNTAVHAVSTCAAGSSSRH